MVSVTITPVNFLTGLDREADRQAELQAKLKPGDQVWTRNHRNHYRPAVFKGWCERTGKARVWLVPQRGGAPRPALVDPAFVTM